MTRIWQADIIILMDFGCHFVEVVTMTVWKLTTPRGKLDSQKRFTYQNLQAFMSKQMEKLPKL